MAAKKILKTNKPVKQSNTKSTKTKSKETAVKKTDKKTSKPSKTNKKEIANIKDGKELAKKIESNVDKSTKHKTRKKISRKRYYTHDGHELTIKEHKFIDNYLSTGNARQSVIEAGYTSKAPQVYGNELLNKPHIAHEIEYLMSQEHNERIATGEQVMEFFTKVMNGEVKDQFGLDAPLGERIKAGQELAKRTVDIATKVAGVTQGQNEITIKLDFDRNSL